MFIDVLRSRRFAPLFVCQALSALNDNLLKTALVVLLVFQSGQGQGIGGVALASALFILPTFCLSGLGGEIADRFDKARVARAIKAAEVAAAGLAAGGIAFASTPALYVALTLFGIAAALFGPVKYGILPDHLDARELPTGNALIEGATFLAILAGTLVAGTLSEGHPLVLAGLIVSAAIASWAAARAIPATTAAAPDLALDRNIFASSLRLVRDLKADARLWTVGLALGWFWALGTILMNLTPNLVRDVLGGDVHAVSAAMAIFAIGIGIGSVAGAWLSHGRLLLLAVPLAGTGMGLVSLDLGRIAMTTTPATQTGLVDLALSWRGLNTGFDLGLIALLGGLYVVPAFSALQAWSPATHRARTVAATNLISAGLMVLASLAVGTAATAGLSMGGVLLATGGLGLIIAYALGRALPINVIADVLSVLFGSLFRMEVKGRENLAKRTGPAIIALNHVSFLDAALALSILDEAPVFAIDAGIAKRWWVRPFLRLVNAMPLDPTKPIATRTLINAVRAGSDLVIFPEGRLTVTGSLMKVYDGTGLVADKTGAQIVPVRIDGLERSLFSRLKRGQVKKAFFPKVTVTILEPTRLTIEPGIKGKHRRQAAGAALYEVMSDLIYRTSATDHTLFTAVAAAARVQGPRRVILEDPVAGKLTYARLLAGARALGVKLSAYAAPDARVGLLLPNANATAVTLLGLVSARRVPAMLNVSAGEANILAACRAAEIGVIVTSRGFVEKARLGALIARLEQDHRIVYLEDVRASIGWRDKLSALRQREQPILPTHADAPAVVLFTSGSEGTPKGVVLSHRNMLTNTAQAQARIDFGRTDKVFNVLPVFHAFGLTIGLILPIVSGVPVYLYPSPLHYRIVPELVYASNSTILFGTDTFLTGYAKTAHAYDFRSLRYIIAGAEPVKAVTRQTYMSKFGLRILEGYGVTETGPVIALNTPMFTRDGTVGRVMPGLKTRLDPVPGIEEGGRLSVHGPNVMLGYLRAEKPGVLEPPVDGWHDTGDIVTLDTQGYVTIKGRAKRFAKIGGEMVSLAMLEVHASSLWPDAISAAATVPDPRKGERIVLYTTQKTADRSEFAAYAKGKGVSDLAIPSEVRRLDAIPLLGSGKIDFAAVSRLAKGEIPAQAA